jgi:hypothetical protein
MFGLAEAEAHCPEETADTWALAWAGGLYFSYKVGGWLVEWAWWLL